VDPVVMGGNNIVRNEEVSGLGGGGEGGVNRLQ
jgi:hypothetical protein